jgi:hypothetical protein
MFVLKKIFNVDASQINITVLETKVIPSLLILYTTTAFHI